MRKNQSQDYNEKNGSCTPESKNLTFKSVTIMSVLSFSAMPTFT